MSPAALPMSLLSTIFTGESSLSSFAHLMEMAFGCGIAYAVLIRTGIGQGNHIENYCTDRHSEATETHALLASENKALVEKIDIGPIKLRCDNHVVGCCNKMSHITKQFAIASIAVSIFCVFVLLIAGIWDPVK